MSTETMVGQERLLAEAIQMADAGATQEEIVAALQQWHPGLPSENHYLNPAAVAVMRRIRREQREQTALEQHLERLRARGLPEAWAYRDRGLEPPGPEREDEPTPEELARVTRGAEMLALCARYEIYFAIAEDGEWRTSRPIRIGGPLQVALQRFKAGIMAGLRAQGGDGA